MNRLSYGHSSLCQESRRLVLDGELTVALTEENADPTHGLSIRDSDSRYFFASQRAACRPKVQVHYGGFLMKSRVTNMYINSHHQS